MKNIVKKTLNKIGVREDESRYWTSYPMAIQIDTTNKCGPSQSGVFCSYCFPQGEVLSGRDFHAEMPMEWIKWILNDAAQNMPRITKGEWPPLQQICLFLNGDWQNESRSEEILDLYDKLLPWLPNQVFTCATKPDQAWRFTNPKLKWICITCSASDRETYKKVHGGDKFIEVLETMQFIDKNSSPNQHLEVHYVVTKDNIQGIKKWYDLMSQMFPRWRRVMSPLVKSKCNQRSVDSMGDLTVEFQEQTIKSVDQQAQFWNHQTTPYKQPCVLHSNAAVTVHGEILQCCNWDRRNVWNYGYIQDYIDEGRSLKDYWMERLANKQRNPLCRACNLRHPQYKQRLQNIEAKIKVLP
jgi:hypothetical protein